MHLGLLQLYVINLSKFSDYFNIILVGSSVAAEPAERVSEEGKAVLM